MSLNHSPSAVQPNLSFSTENEFQPESTSSAGLGISKPSVFQPENASPTVSASFKPTDFGFNEFETVAERCLRQNQRPMPWTSSPIVQRETARVCTKPTAALEGAADKKHLNKNWCKTLNSASHGSGGLEDDPEHGAIPSTDAKRSIAAPKDFRPLSAMERIKRLFIPQGKRSRDNPKEVRDDVLTKGEGRDPVRWEVAKDYGGNHGTQSDTVMPHHAANKAGSNPQMINPVLEPGRSGTTEHLDSRDVVRKEGNRYCRIKVIETAASHRKQNWLHGWRSKKHRKPGESFPMAEVCSSQDANVLKGVMLSACLMQASSTSPADETAPDIPLSQKIPVENALNLEIVDSTEGSAPRISPTDEDLLEQKQRELLPGAVMTQGPEPSSSKGYARRPNSEALAAKSLSRIQSIENVERWLKHGYQAPRHMKSRQHLSRRSRRNYLQYIYHHRSSISSSEYAISPTNDHHRCAWEHCQSEKGFGSNDSYHKNCDEPPCDGIDVKTRKKSDRSQERTLFDADGTSQDGELRPVGGAVRGACQNRSAEGSLSKLNPSLLQFVAELFEGLEKAKHNDSEWSTRFMEKTSTPVVPCPTISADEKLASVSQRNCCRRSDAKTAFDPVFHDADLSQNQNPTELKNGSKGGSIKPSFLGTSEKVASCPRAHFVGLNLDSTDHGNTSEKLKKGEILNRPTSLSETEVVPRCTVQQLRTFSLNKLPDNFSSLKTASHLPPQSNKMLLPGRTASPSLLKRCLLQTLEHKSEISVSHHVLSASACHEDDFQDETEIVGHQPFAKLSADGLSFHVDGRNIQYNVLHQPDPTEVLDEIRLVAQEAKTLQQNTTEILEHIINIQWKTIRSLRSTLSEEQAKRREVERKLEQLTSHPTEGGINNNVTAKLK